MKGFFLFCSKKVKKCQRKVFFFSLSLEEYKWTRLSNEITTNTMNDVRWFVQYISKREQLCDVVTGLSLVRC